MDKNAFLRALGVAPSAKIQIQPWLPKAYVEVACWRDNEHQLGALLATRVGVGIAASSPGLAQEGEQGVIFKLAPRCWIIASDSLEPHEIVSVVAEPLGSVTDLTDSRVGFRLTGEAARAVLAKGTGIDLRADVFVAGCYAFTAIHDIAVMLYAVLEPDGLAINVYTSATFAADLGHWLEDAAMEFRY